MKEMKIDFNSEMVQECGRVPVFNEKNASTLSVIVAIPFDKNFNQHKAADPALIKAICRHQPVRLTRELYELVELKVD